MLKKIFFVVLMFWAVGLSWGQEAANVFYAKVPSESLALQVRECH